MESLVCFAAQVFSYANEPNGDATKAIDDVFGLVVRFCMKLLRLLRTSSGSWHNGTSF